MKLILDVDHVIREMNISTEVFAIWKAASLERSAEGGQSLGWKPLEEGSFMNRAFTGSPADFKMS